MATRIPATADSVGTVGRPDGQAMRAVVQGRYGPPDVLRIAEVARPAPTQDQVLVRVEASSVNARDWHIMRGEPRVARLLDRSVFSHTSPRLPIRGTDVVGTVVAVGSGVTRWRPGDRIFGEASGAWAEYALAAQDAVAAVPGDLGAEEAAALPLAGTTALMCLSAGGAPEGGRLLVNGASGGVGTFAVQMAHERGMDVTAVCSARNADQARLMGATTVVDYAVDDFCAGPERYDLVVDLVGNRSVRALRNLVLPTGTLVMSGGGAPGTGRLIGPMGLLVRALVLARTPGPRIVVPQARPTTARLEELAGLAQRGALVPVIDRVFSLEEAADAVRYVETEHARGKVILRRETGAHPRPSVRG